MKDQLREILKMMVRKLQGLDSAEILDDVDMRIVNDDTASILELFSKPIDTKFDEKNLSLAKEYCNSHISSENEGVFLTFLEALALAQSFLDGTLDRPMSDIFSFRESVENGEKTLWLCFENGMINLNALAAAKVGIVGAQLERAIARALAGKIPAPEKSCPEPEAHRCKNCGNFYEDMPMGEAPCFGKTSANCGMWTPIERLVEANKMVLNPDVSSEFPAEIKHIGIDLVDEFFPKGVCKERGQAIVLYAQLIIRFQKLMTEKGAELSEAKNLVNTLANLETFNKLRAEIARLGAERETLCKTFYKDICSTNQFYFPKPICKRMPPESSDFYNACLSCQIFDTCRQVKDIAAKALEGK